jgi:micrococcal nuclease
MYEYRGHVRRVHDGDTVELDVDLGMDITRHLPRARLDGLDAPELRTEAGIRSYVALRALAEGVTLTVHTIKLKTLDKERTEKYGRYLVRLVLPSGVDVNAWLIEQGYARPYTGGARG